MSDGNVLVAGIGNIFLGDDGFGVEVVRQLSTVDLPDGVRVVDYGIRGMHLAYDLAGGNYDLTVLVDATSRGDAPGTVYVIELDPAASLVDSVADAGVLDAHGMQPDVVLSLVRLLGADPGRVLLVGCEPETLESGMGLSPAVARAVGTACAAVAELAAGNSREELSCAWAFPAK